jgi:hypothetical protein
MVSYNKFHWFAFNYLDPLVIWPVAKRYGFSVARTSLTEWQACANGNLIGNYYDSLFKCLAHAVLNRKLTPGTPAEAGGLMGKGYRLTDEEVASCHTRAVLAQKYDGKGSAFTTLFAKEIQDAIFGEKF